MHLSAITLFFSFFSNLVKKYRKVSGEVFTAYFLDPVANYEN